MFGTIVPSQFDFSKMETANSILVFHHVFRLISLQVNPSQVYRSIPHKFEGQSLTSLQILLNNLITLRKITSRSSNVLQKTN